jgi:hypothetical protein
MPAMVRLFPLGMEGSLDIDFFQVECNFGIPVDQDGNRLAMPPKRSALDDTTVPQIDLFSKADSRH